VSTANAVEGTESCHLFWHGAPAGAPGQTNARSPSAHINQSPDSRVDIAGLIRREAANYFLEHIPKYLGDRRTPGSAHSHARERCFEAYQMQQSEMWPLSGSLALGEGPGGGPPLPAEEFWDNLLHNH
jgi:hypothetical protein